MAVDDAGDGQPAESERKVDTATLAAKLAPPEELAGKRAEPKAYDDGAIILNTGSFKMPKNTLVEEHVSWLSRPAPVVVVLVIIALIFILMMAVFISLMPVKAE